MKKLHSVIFMHPISVQVSMHSSRHVGTYSASNEAYMGWTFELRDQFVVVHSGTIYTTYVPLHFVKQMTFKAELSDQKAAPQGAAENNGRSKKQA